MEVSQAIKERRAYRFLAPVDITADLIRDLAENASLAPSCFNNQPWRFVFVRSPQRIREMREALSSGNKWAHSASMIIAVFSKKEDDCIIKNREYHQFDCGIAVGFLLLRATELGLIAHPIAGFSPKKTREILRIPEEYQVITLIIVGKHSKDISENLSDKQREAEKARPLRTLFEEFSFLDNYRG